jgi:hypothetical protein
MNKTAGLLRAPAGDVGDRARGVARDAAGRHQGERSFRSGVVFVGDAEQPDGDRVERVQVVPRPHGQAAQLGGGGTPAGTAGYVPGAQRAVGRALARCAAITCAPPLLPAHRHHLLQHQR